MEIYSSMRVGVGEGVVHKEGMPSLGSGGTETG